MGASDGSIGATTKVVDHGPNGSRWNLVILGDGYRATEIAQYHTDVQNFLTAIRGTAPYDELWCGINVHRIDVTSTDSGADDPATCPDPLGPTGSGATPNTFFDAKYCSVGPGGARLSRLLTIDSARAQAAASARVPEVHQVLVIVNAGKYGGSGGSVATCSTNSLAAEIAIHEIGHSFYLLADEYGGDGSATPAGEPPEPNVTRDTNRATNKWRALIAATTPMPSACGTGCTGCTPPTTPPAAGAVGTYEGGKYANCGVYRPLPDCKMRNLGVAFCPVCAGVIRAALSGFLPPESITLMTPSISFSNIPEGIGGTGVTTWRAITFEVIACRRLTFQIISGPTGGFGTPLGTSASSGPAAIGPLDRVHLWLSYTSTTATSAANGLVTVRCNETGQTYVITISANTVARPKSAVALVLDHSGSMAEDAGDNTTKVQKLRESVQVFVDAMLPGDGIGIVRFDDTVQRLMSVTDVGALTTGTGRQTAITTVNGPQLDPAGGTSIGGGVAEGKQTLDDAQASASPTYDVTAMVVLTDGVENTTPMIADVGSSITANTFAIGLGLPSNISVAALNALTQGHNGYLVVTGALTQDQRFYLSKYFLQVLAGITSANVVVDPQGELALGAQHRIPFLLTEADYGVDAFLLCPAPQVVAFELETPDGSRITPADLGALGTGAFVSRGATAFYRISLPAIPAQSSGSHGGTWYAILSIERPSTWDRASYWSASAPHAATGGRGVLPYDVLVHCYSNLVFAARAVQTSYEPGALVNMYATLREYDVPVEGRASVWVEVLGPDLSASVIPLAVDGPGRFAGSLRTTIPGVYRLRIRAQGVTTYQKPFTREQTATAVAIPGGDRPGSVRPPDLLGDLLCCLARGGALTPASIQRLMPGADPDLVLRCLKRLCAQRQAAAEGGASEGRRRGAENDLVSELSRLGEVLRERLRALLG
jgi:hypothetical protein